MLWRTVASLLRVVMRVLYALTARKVWYWVSERSHKMIISVEQEPSVRVKDSKKHHAGCQAISKSEDQEHAPLWVKASNAHDATPP